MTALALSPFRPRELFRVRVLMTAIALLRHSRIFRDAVLRRMTLGAMQFQMFPFERKGGLVMREFQFVPRIRGVTRLASVRHLAVELTFMDILMTGRADKVLFPMELFRTLRRDLPVLMAFDTRDGVVRTHQRESGLTVIGAGISGTGESFLGMTGTACTKIFSAVELFRMSIRMTILTRFETGDVKSEITARIPFLRILRMTLLAFHRRMLPFQRELRGVMIECCGLHRVP